MNFEAVGAARLRLGGLEGILGIENLLGIPHMSSILPFLLPFLFARHSSSPAISLLPPSPFSLDLTLCFLPWQPSCLTLKHGIASPSSTVMPHP